MRARTPDHTVSVAVTGARGFVATRLRRLLSPSFRLVGLSRGSFAPMKNETAVTAADYSDTSALASHMRGCDAVIHLVGTDGRGGGGDSGPGSYADVNAGVTSRVADAARRAGAKQIVFLSGLGASATNPSEYFASKFRAEQLIRGSGTGYTIFRPSFIVGKGDYLTRSLNRQIRRRGAVAIPGDGKYLLQPILASDAVGIIRDSLLNKRFLNKTLDLVGPKPMTFSRYVTLFCKNKDGAKISKIPLADCLRNALRDPRGAVYSLEDLAIFYGGYMGDFDRLQRAFGGGTISPVGDFLQSRRPP